MKIGDWMVSIDLKYAYFSVPMHGPHRKLLRFRWGKVIFEFQCLPFGLSSALRVFTKMLKPVLAALRRQGIRCIGYTDNLLILAKSRAVLVEIVQETLSLLRLLGPRKRIF